MSNNSIKIMENNKAQVTKAFAKKARIYGTPEYRQWREFIAENPDFVMVTKTIKKNPDKKTTKNLKYENMETFIDEQENAEILKAEFEKVKKMSKVQKSPYDYVLEWFKNKFKNYESYDAFCKSVEEQKEAKKNEAEITEFKPASCM